MDHSNMKFNVAKCRDYINAIQDFQIEVDSGNVVSDFHQITILIDRVSAKKMLHGFILECIDQCKKTDSGFLDWLEKRKQYWKKEQYVTISKLNHFINDETDSNEIDRAKNKKSRFLNLFNHYYDLIKIIEDDVFGGFSGTIKSSLDNGIYEVSDLGSSIGKDLLSVEEIVKKHLAPLSGSLNRRKIMSNEDYNQLVKAVIHIVEKEQAPDKIQSIPTNEVTREFVKYTFHLLRKELSIKGEQIWVLIAFLQATFIIFGDWGTETIYKKFSGKPKKYDDMLKNIVC